MTSVQGQAQQANGAAILGFQLAQTLLPVDGEPASSQCELVFTWSSAPFALSYSATTIPGKFYSYKIAATNQPLQSQSRQVGAFSDTVAQKANAIQRFVDLQLVSAYLCFIFSNWSSVS